MRSVDELAALIAEPTAEQVEAVEPGKAYRVPNRAELRAQGLARHGRYRVPGRRHRTGSPMLWQQITDARLRRHSELPRSLGNGWVIVDEVPA